MQCLLCKYNIKRTGRVCGTIHLMHLCWFNSEFSFVSYNCFGGIRTLKIMFTGYALTTALRLQRQLN